jgi:predicted dehydrogenase
MLEAVLIGAGQRGADVYGQFGLDHPDRLRFTAVAEPDAVRRQQFGEAHGIPEARQFESWQALVAQQPLAQAAVICTPDRVHAEPAVAAMQAGYHILLEKPMATTLEDCRRLVAISDETNRQLHICHVLRYTRHFAQMREILQSGRLGEITNVDHRENVAYFHMAHSFVRGNWGKAADSSPMILAKCSHDLDILVWLLDQRCDQLSSTGRLSHFRPDNAPEGAPRRCTDGCPAEDSCPYEARSIYLRLEPLRRHADDPARFDDYRGWPVSVLSPDPTPANLEAALQEGPYGRCVYHAGSDVVDHQVVSMQFEGGQSVTLTMHGHSHKEGRTTRIQGSRAELTAFIGTGGAWIELAEHRSGQVERFDTGPDNTSGHGGGDAALISAFISSLQTGAGGATLARAALESHLMAFAAEEARLAGRVVRMDEWR